MAKTQSQDATRASLSALLDDARQELTASLQGLTAEQMEIPLPEGWSVKDVVAHVAMWEEITLPDMYRAMRGRHTVTGSWEGPFDDWNDIQFELRRDFPLAQVMEELAETRRATLEALRAAPEARLTSGFIPVTCAIYAQHDREHAAQIRDWRQKASI